MRPRIYVRRNQRVHSSTLFPYATLFRSSPRSPGGTRSASRVPPGDRGLDDPRGLRGHVEAERKSTRLNSRHLGTSYAVLGEEKKTNDETTLRGTVARAECITCSDGKRSS